MSSAPTPPHRSSSSSRHTDPDSPGNPPATGDCPNENSIRDLAAGLASPVDAAQLTQHAAQCDHCGPILRAYTEDFSDDLSAEDVALLLKLESSSQEWQRQLVRKMIALAKSSEDQDRQK